MLYFIVVSPHPSQVQILLERYKEVVDEKILLVIKEFGKKGDHVHLNYIVDSAKRGDSLRRSLIRLCCKKGILSEGVEQAHFVSVIKITDLENLLGGYLQKEPNHEVLMNEGKYDLVELKKKIMKDKVRISDHKFKEVLRIDTFAQAASAFCEINGLDLKTTSTEDILKRMAKDNYGIAACLRQIDLCRNLISYYY